MFTLTLQTWTVEKRARVRSASGGWPRAVRLRRIEAYLTVREIGQARAQIACAGASSSVLAGSGLQR